MAWVSSLPNNHPQDWVFPSETLKTPIAKHHVWRRNFLPKLRAAGLGWVDFHVFRRTHSTLMRESGADPKTVADNMGPTLDVNQNVYTQTPLNMRKDAVNALDSNIFLNSFGSVLEQAAE
jgi:integrase